MIQWMTLDAEIAMNCIGEVGEDGELKKYKLGVDF